MEGAAEEAVVAADEAGPRGSPLLLSVRTDVEAEGADGRVSTEGESILRGVSDVSAGLFPSARADERGGCVHGGDAPMASADRRPLLSKGKRSLITVLWRVTCSVAAPAPP